MKSGSRPVGILFSYGHPRNPGAAPGYLNNPDDAYLLRNGDITVADPMNCRVLVLDPGTKTVLDQIGTPGNCTHDPPNAVGSPNGDTPLSDGNLLVSEINGSWVDEYTTRGRLGTDSYPSATPPTPRDRDRFLVADYESPGGIVEFNRDGRSSIVTSRRLAGELNHPHWSSFYPQACSFERRLQRPHGRYRPANRALVWQYGDTGTPGTAAGLLNTPDGFDILGPGGSTPTHTATG